MRRFVLAVKFAFALFYAGQAYADNFEAIRQTSGFVPASKLANELNSEKFACIDFDKASMTCSMILRATTWWWKDAREMFILLKSKPRFLLKGTFVTKQKAHADDFLCSIVETISVHVDIPPHLLQNAKIVSAAKRAELSLEQDMLNQSLVCDAFFDSDRGYILRSYDENGDPHPDYEPSKIEFFEQKPALREPPIDTE